MEVKDEEWHHTLGVNMHAAFYLIKAVLPGMMERKSGSIIGLGGQSAITGRPGLASLPLLRPGFWAYAGCGCGDGAIQHKGQHG
ncbi:MAG: hypothetical protein CM1200mP22_01830 [Dehalococcoidia bacterium]|nr:MAG: hypothetical protein CM1200mP22_01830 [Dehalococcoidia bacterium]